MKAPTYVVSIALFNCALWGGACSGSDVNSQSPPPPCVENLNLSCNVLHDPPIYPTIYKQIIQPQCTLGSGCHSTDGAMGGLVLANAEDTYDALLGLKGGTKRVVPRDAACSPLMVRLESHDPNFQMPRGSRLSDAELCDFVKWIQAGASEN
jgi:hypothetical protein